MLDNRGGGGPQVVLDEVGDPQVVLGELARRGG